jgi:hypothetical protein
VDAEIVVTRQENIITMTVAHMRDGPEGTEVRGRAKSIPLGFDVNGRELNSLVIEKIDGPGDGFTGSVHGRTRGPSEGQQLALSILNRCLSQYGEPLPAGLDVVGLRGVRLDRWHAEMIAAHALSDDEDGSRQWRRFKSTLQTRRLIRIHDPWVWVPLP